MQQDFSKKMVVVLREGLGSWPLTNTVGHISAFLGNKMRESFDTGSSFKSKDGLDYPRNSQYAVVVLSATLDELRELVEVLRTKDLLWIAYVQEMIDMIDDEELSKSLEEKSSGQMDLLGVGLFGAKEELKLLTGKFKLWK